MDWTFSRKSGNGGYRQLRESNCDKIMGIYQIMVSLLLCNNIGNLFDGYKTGNIYTDFRIFKQCVDAIVNRIMSYTDKDSLK